jgi:hypothetical protein
VSEPTPALYVPDGDRFMPTDYTRGPWDRHAQHGGPPAALLAECLDRVEAPQPMQVARLTVELLRPVPIEPLRVETSVLRPGRKVQLAAATLWAAGVEVARATALRIRVADVAMPSDLPPAPPPPGPREGVASQPPWNDAIHYTSFHRDGVEHRFVRGTFADPGPATDWIRLRVSLLAERPISPLARVVAAADFGNGVSWALSRNDGYLFINPDLTLYLHRLPAGEWVCLESATYPEPSGIGVAESRLWDEQGPLGRGLQTLLLEKRG